MSSPTYKMLDIAKLESLTNNVLLRIQREGCETQLYKEALATMLIVVNDFHDVHTWQGQSRPVAMFKAVPHMQNA